MSEFQRQNMNNKTECCINSGESTCWANDPQRALTLMTRDLWAWTTSSSGWGSWQQDWVALSVDKLFGRVVSLTVWKIPNGCTVFPRTRITYPSLIKNFMQRMGLSRVKPHCLHLYAEPNCALWDGSVWLWCWSIAAVFSIPHLQDRMSFLPPESGFPNAVFLMKTEQLSGF